MNMRTDPPALLGGDTLELLLAGAAGVVQHQEVHTRALRASLKTWTYTTFWASENQETWNRISNRMLFSML